MGELSKLVRNRYGSSDLQRPSSLILGRLDSLDSGRLSVSDRSSH